VIPSIWAALLRILVSVSLLVLCSACKRSGEEPAKQETKTIRIAVIPKGTTHEFWKSVHAGAVKAGRELGVDVAWKGPLKEDDLKSQIDLVQSFTAQAVTGMVLAPLNDSALVSSVKSAARAGIPVVVIDSDLKGSEHTSFVATDNRAAGRTAGDHMAKLLGGRGRVIVLRYQEGSASTRNREEGFLEAVRKHPAIAVRSDNQYGGATTESAFSASENLLLAQGAATGGVDGIFTPNESTTFGMLLALDKAKLAGKLKFIGFDASEKLIAALQGGKLHGLMLQDPFRMGYLGVRNVVLHLRGQPVEKRVDTGSKLVTPENMKEPEMQRLLRPDLREWLGR
jgi:ribose transport system substrate-binding protein